MREILFRGKREDNGEWIKGCLSLYSEGGVAEMVYPIKMEDEEGNIYTDFDFVTVIHETVGQFTGLFDKNDKKVFEGDIIAYTPRSNCTIIYEVTWQQEYSRFSLVQWSTHRYRLYEWAELEKVKYMCEVIGNIHDNPELLEVE